MQTLNNGYYNVKGASTLTIGLRERKKEMQQWTVAMVTRLLPDRLFSLLPTCYFGQFKFSTI